jgi:hypothetical protein
VCPLITNVIASRAQRYGDDSLRQPWCRRRLPSERRVDPHHCEGGCIEALDKAVIAFVSKPPAERSAAAEDQIRQRIEAVKVDRERLQPIFNDRFPDYAALSKPQPVSVPDPLATASEKITRDVPETLRCRTTPRPRNLVPPKTVTVRSFMAAEAQIRQLTREPSRPYRSGHVNGMPTRRYP